MGLHDAARTVAKAILPNRVFAAIAAFRSREYQKLLLQESGHTEALRELTSRCGHTVLHGPFRGMIYPPDSLSSRQGIPLLLGTYESELHSIISAIRPGDYDRVIDIGCAEGYYAVGLARLTFTSVFGFDTEFRERAFCRRMAELNGVASLVTVSGWCDARMLNRLAMGRCLIISDCEGYERELFTEETVPYLSGSDLIIELHEDGKSRETESTILRRFSATHHAELFAFSQSCKNLSIPELNLCPDVSRFIRENRQEGQHWVYLRANEPAGLPATP
jgi:hypothetical protein